MARAELSGRREIARRAAGAMPQEVSFAYYDRARDFQAGLQRATTGEGAPRSEARALPVALAANEAKALAEFRLAALRAGRTSAKLTLGWARAGLRPGGLVTLEGESGLWAIRRATLGAMDVALELQRVTGATLPGVATASPGLGGSQPDLPHGPTILRLLELPIADPPVDRALVFVAAAGSEPGWRRAGLLMSFDGGESWEEAGFTAAPAVMGQATTVLAAGQSCLFDDSATVDVELLNETMWLENASDDALLDGANLACLGDELVQFGRAQWLGGNSFRLSRLLRARRATEWATGLHAAGDSFTLIERTSLAAIEIPPERIGGLLTLSAKGIGDEEPVAASAAIRGDSLTPPAPVHLAARRLDSGDIEIEWVRRSRLGWSWTSGADTPLGEEAEAYRLAISGAGFGRSVALPNSNYLYTTAAQAADGASGPIHISVSQVGTHAVSRECELTLE